jgi:GWxTD domain-containing protein
MVLAGGELQAQLGEFSERDLAEPRVQWDHNVFGPRPEGPFRLEVYYKIFNDGLTYRKDNGRYVAAYQVEVLLYRGGDQVASTTFDEQYPVESFPRTLSQTDFLVNQLNIMLNETGKFDLVMRLRDLKSNQVSESRKGIEIESKPDTWHMSKLEFARHIETAEDTSQFNKQGWLVVPSVSRSYGGETQLNAPVYAEIYGPKDSKGAPLGLRITAFDESGGTVLDTQVTFASHGRITPATAELPVRRLPPGSYRLEVQLLAKEGLKPQSKQDGVFHIGWSLPALLRSDYKTAVEQLRYIASDDERDSLLESPDSLRAKLWESFWEKRDPTSGTPMNEFRDEYYRRIRYANASFSVGKRPGWRTDRGMIYIRYGEPDEVERHPFDLAGKPYNGPWQVWYYYNPSRRFVFVDDRGSGDYDLEYPYDGDPWIK